MRDKPTWTLFKGVLFSAAVLLLLGFLRTWPPFQGAGIAAGEAPALVRHETLAIAATPTIFPTRVPPTASPAPLPTKPASTATPTPTPVPLPAAGRSRELTRGKGSLFDRVPVRHESGRVAGRPPTPTPIPTPPSQPPTRIVAHAIGLDAPVVPMYWKKVTHGDKVSLLWQVPRNEAGWHFTSALPGLPGNTVISGHRNIYSEVFRNLDDLQVGDEIKLIAGNAHYVYKVDETHVLPELGVSASVRAENAQWIARTDDIRLTLVTCWPYEAPGNTHRLIVVARP